MNPGNAFSLLKESVGTTMFCWCRLEDALSESFRRMAPRNASRLGGPFNERLLKWASYLDANFPGDEAANRELSNLMRRIDDVRRLRNLIVHRLAGFSADPSKGEPHIVCMEGEQHARAPLVITQTDLFALNERVMRCSVELTRIEAIRMHSTMGT